MSEIAKILIDSHNDDIFLNTLRNAFIFLLIALALLEFRNKFTKYATFALLIVLATLILALINYWRSGSRRLLPISFIVIAAILLVSWILYESIKVNT